MNNPVNKEDYEEEAACFIAGTLISTKDGHKKIEDIEVGDYVWAENPETGEKALKQVTNTFIRETDELIYIAVDGEKITTTPEHPFYVPQKGWVKAIDLRVGEILVLRSGKYVIVEKIQHEILENPITVYSFEVEDFHTYYVGNPEILVHNAQCGMNNLRTLQETNIKGYKVSMDLEKGGSGLNNIHLKVGDTKYYYNVQKGEFINKAGKRLPKLLRNSSKIKNALTKALDRIKGGW